MLAHALLHHPPAVGSQLAVPVKSAVTACGGSPATLAGSARRLRPRGCCHNPHDAACSQTWLPKLLTKASASDPFILQGCPCLEATGTRTRIEARAGRRTHRAGSRMQRTTSGRKLPRSCGPWHYRGMTYAERAQKQAPLRQLQGTLPGLQTSPAKVCSPQPLGSGSCTVQSSPRVTRPA